MPPQPTLLPQPVIDLFSNHQKRRIVLRFWPRSPTGKPISPQHTLSGKQAPNGIHLWGATLLDFYRTQRFPQINNLVTISTGSKLMQWMIQNGETDTCLDEIKWAEQEHSPCLIPVYDHAKLILENEDAVRKNAIWNTDSLQGWAFDDPGLKDTDFDPEKYPSPWPLEPFTFNSTILHEKLPFTRLPQKLFVHTTKEILQTNLKNSDPEQERRVYEYKLKLSTAGKARLETHRKEQDARQKMNEQTPHSFKILPDPETTQPGPIEPVINLIHPPPPQALRSPEVAHLYISRDHHLANSRHSEVYNVELELPRDTLVPDLLCSKCAVDEANKNLDDSPIGNEKGIWQKEWRTVGSACQYDIYKYDKPEDVVNIVKDAEVKGEWVYDYKGPLRDVKVDIESQNPYKGKPYCGHISPLEFSKHPPTARVQLVAKLSKQDDDHLETEAAHYQKFPEHFFEHWSGYNVIPPLHDPTPIGALVPQFYGYYAPVEDEEWLSPILLLENCGSQIHVDNISPDDKNECASLIYRMHEAGWSHGSVFERNFVRQKGPLWKHPSERGQFGGSSGLDSEYSYRLIDFGRSKDLLKIKNSKEGNKCVRTDMNGLDSLFQHLFH